MSGSEDYGRSVSEPPTPAAQKLTHSNIQKAVEYINGIILGGNGEVRNNPIRIEFGNGVSMFEGDDFHGVGLTSVGRAIAASVGIKPDTTRAFSI